MSQAAADAAFSKGLEGIIAGETSICSIEQGGLFYRGYEIHDLAQNATFDEVAFLLLEGHKPGKSELDRFKAEIRKERPLPANITRFLQESGPALKAGTAVPMDVLRSAVSILGHTDPDCQSVAADANLRKAKRLLAKIPTVIGQMQNVIDGRPLVAPETGGDPALDHAANLMYLMSGTKPSPDYARVIDVSLILYAEHDFNASTFTSRVIAGTLSDMHGASAGAIAALKGPLHGGANEMAMEMLKEIMHDVGEAGIGTPKVDDWMHRAFETKRKLMGFGHRVYKEGDPRARILREMSGTLTRETGQSHLYEMSVRIDDVMQREKGLLPNVDFYSATVYHSMGIPHDLFTPVFAMSRVAGWCAHVMEQYANNRIYRPRGRYRGPTGLRYEPIDRR
ncbi:citrate synthase [Phycisphaerales bacterium]|nr:citrate synthase [Phycisphaerales bacterium]